LRAARILLGRLNLRLERLLHQLEAHSEERRG